MARPSDAQNELRMIRDTAQSIWVAIVLAFVLRAFVLEAFVIPTGSMATTLLGQHFQLTCRACQMTFPFAPNDFVTESTTKLQSVAGARCPNCGASVGDAFVPSSAGDRVLVLKYLYSFVPPQRWDVVVFRNPQDNHMMYIKRLVGLPGETLAIVRGDVFIRDGDGEYRVATKPKSVQDAMWQLVHDNNYIADHTKAPDAPQWTPADGQADRWTTAHAGRSFLFAGSAPSTSARLEFRAPRDVFLPQSSYNLIEPNSLAYERDIVTDLRLSCVFIPADPTAALALRLTSFDDTFRAEITADGTVRLLYDTGKGLAVQTTQLLPLVPGTGYELALEHADLGVRFYVDDRLVFQSTPAEYHVTYHQAVNRARSLERVPKPEVTVEASGGASQVRHLRVMRDVYYTATKLEGKSGLGWPQYEVANLMGLPGSERDAAGWGSLDKPIELVGGQGDLDEFFMLGDNSAVSLDSRAWTAASPTLRLWVDPHRDHDLDNLQYHLGTVPRYNLMGRAFFVYWPAGHRLPGLVPAVPNVGQMRRIR